jgi:hypothetical protein
MAPLAGIGRLRGLSLADFAYSTTLDHFTSIFELRFVVWAFVCVRVLIKLQLLGQTRFLCELMSILITWSLKSQFREQSLSRVLPQMPKRCS